MSDFNVPPKATLILLASLLGSTAALSDELPDLSPFHIVRSSVVGNGCPNGSYDARLNDSKNAFLLSYKKFDLDLPVDPAVNQVNKGCRLSMIIRMAPGWQYRIDRFEGQGEVDLAAHAKAEINASYSFQGSPLSGSLSFNDHGPKSGPFAYVYGPDLNGPFMPDAWSPCTGEHTLLVNTTALLKKDGNPVDEPSFLVSDQAGTMRQTLGIRWRRCEQPQQPAFPIPYKVYELVSRHSGECVQTANHSTDAGMRLVQWHCTGDDHQKYRFAGNMEGLGSLVNVGTGKVLGVLGASPADGAAIDQEVSAQLASQAVQLEPATHGSFQLRFKHSSKCLDIVDRLPKPRIALEQRTCAPDEAAQEWFLRPVVQEFPRTDIYRFVSRQNGKCLTALGSTLQTRSCNSEIEQNFRLVQSAIGIHNLTAVASNQNITVMGASDQDLAPVVLSFPGHGQQLHLVPSTDGTYSLRFISSNKCLTHQPGMLDSGSLLQTGCSEAAQQDWYLQKVSL